MYEIIQKQLKASIETFLCCNHFSQKQKTSFSIFHKNKKPHSSALYNFTQSEILWQLSAKNLPFVKK